MDVAAVMLIVREAGGRATDMGGGETIGGGSLVSTNGLLHDAALAALGANVSEHPQVGTTEG